jgi:hypothetical protein
MYWIIALMVVAFLAFYLPFNKSFQDHFINDNWSMLYDLCMVTRFGINEDTERKISDAAIQYMFFLFFSLLAGLIWPLSLPVIAILFLVRRFLIKKGLKSKTKNK